MVRINRDEVSGSRTTKRESALNLAELLSIGIVEADTLVLLARCKLRCENVFAHSDVDGTVEGQVERMNEGEA